MKREGLSVPKIQNDKISLSDPIFKLHITLFLFSFFLKKHCFSFWERDLRLKERDRVWQFFCCAFLFLGFMRFEMQFFCFWLGFWLGYLMDFFLFLFSMRLEDLLLLVGFLLGSLFGFFIVLSLGYFIY